MRHPILPALVVATLGCAGAPAAPPAASTDASRAPTASADSATGATPSSSSTAAPGPSRLIVHVDNVRPDKVAQFQKAREAFIVELTRRGVDDLRGHYFKLGESRFVSVVPFHAFAELDALSRKRSSAQDAMKGVIEEYDRLADEGLVFPHGNELWTERSDLAYLPTGRPLEAAVEVVIEDVDPTCDYGEAWQAVAGALAKASYPFERRAFSSSYGTGKMMVFWLATTPGPRPPAPPVACVLRSESMPARFMDAMSLP